MAVLMGGALFALAAPAGAGAKTVRVTTHVSGGPVVSWHGDAARGSVPLDAIRRPALTLHLNRGSSVAGGYTGAVRLDLTLTLRRTRVRERVVTETVSSDEIVRSALSVESR